MKWHPRPLCLTSPCLVSPKHLWPPEILCICLHAYSLFPSQNVGFIGIKTLATRPAAASPVPETALALRCPVHSARPSVLFKFKNNKRITSSPLPSIPCLWVPGRWKPHTKEGSLGGSWAAGGTRWPGCWVTPPHHSQTQTTRVLRGGAVCLHGHFICCPDRQCLRLAFKRTKYLEEQS